MLVPSSDARTVFLVDTRRAVQRKYTCVLWYLQKYRREQEGVFRLTNDLRRERVPGGVDRIIASLVAVDRWPIR